MLKKFYCWKELSEDGLLREPYSRAVYAARADCSFHPNEFESEEEAVAAFDEHVSNEDVIEYDKYQTLVLVSFYKVVY